MLRVFVDICLQKGLSSRNPLALCKLNADWLRSGKSQNSYRKVEGEQEKLE